MPRARTIAPTLAECLITVEDGRATKIQGDPSHPVTRGFLCAKVAKYLDRVYSPDRVLYPMRRVAAKGPAEAQRSSLLDSRGRLPGRRPTQVWQRITWDEALDEIAERFRAIMPSSAPKRFCPIPMAEPSAR